MVRYKDIDFGLKKHPITNDIAVKTDKESIKQSLCNLFQLKPYDKPMHPEIYGLYDLLFEQMDKLTKAAVEKRARDLIINYEPRIEPEQIIVKDHPNENGIIVTVSYYIKNLNQLETVDLFIERKR